MVEIFTDRYTLCFGQMWISLKELPFKKLLEPWAWTHAKWAKAVKSDHLAEDISKWIGWKIILFASINKSILATSNQMRCSVQEPSESLPDSSIKKALCINLVGVSTYLIFYSHSLNCLCCIFLTGTECFRVFVSNVVLQIDIQFCFFVCVSVFSGSSYVSERREDGHNKIQPVSRYVEHYCYYFP